MDRQRGSCLKLYLDESLVPGRADRAYLSGPILGTEDEGLNPEVKQGLLMKVANQNKAEAVERSLELRDVLVSRSLFAHIFQDIYLLLVHHNASASNRLSAGSCRARDLP